MELFLHYLSLPYLLQGVGFTLAATALGLGGGLLVGMVLAAVIAVEELTLRSTQLASSTFDFFSIFCASGVIYLVLTGAIGAIQLVAEFVLDLDRPPLRQRLPELLAWRRPTLAAQLAGTS